MAGHGDSDSTRARPEAAQVTTCRKRGKFTIDEERSPGNLLWCVLHRVVVA
jgi:hypothetical protein